MSANVFSQTENDVKEFMNDLFFSLPMDENKIQLVKEINRNENLNSVEIGTAGINCNVIKNPYLNLSGTDSSLLILFNEQNSVSESKFTIIGKANDKSYSNVVNLLKSLELTSEKTKDSENQETTAFYQKDNTNAFCAVRKLNTSLGPITIIFYFPEYLI
tara:strand:+ start:404 stop:883 length:480 start_codon:yes stop_codon:yes gene_type:complete